MRQAYPRPLKPTAGRHPGARPGRADSLKNHFPSRFLRAIQKMKARSVGNRCWSAIA
ncbi:proline dehydrogenase (plasmid) [Ralstonia solanacearum]|nr:proline dehydrogenase [Ralstonia solanacearum]